MTNSHGIIVFVELKPETTRAISYMSYSFDRLGKHNELTQCTFSRAISCRDNRP